MHRPGYTTVYLSAWWLCVVTLPWYILPNSISIVLLFVVWLAEGNFHEKWNRLKRNAWVWPFVIFFLVHVVGLFYSEDVESGRLELEKKLSLVALPLIAATGRPFANGSFRILRYGFIGSCLAVALASLIATMISYLHPFSPVQNFDPYTTEQFHALFPTQTQGWEYFSYLQLGRWIDIHPAYFSLYLILCILMTLQEIFDQGRAGFFQLFTIILFSFFISLLSSRMAVISFGVTVTYIVLHNFQERKKLQRGFAVLACLFAFLSISIWVNPVSRFRVWIEPLSTPLTLDHTTRWNSVNLRLLEWRASSSAGKTFWPFGAGTGDGQNILQPYYSNYDLGILAFPLNSHNQYLQTIIELGLAGIIMLLFCLYLPVYRAFQHNSLHFSFIVLFGLMCLSESMLARQKGIVFFALFQSLFLSFNAPSHDR